MSFTPINNHAQQALARLVTQYQSSPNLQGLISALVGPIQEIETVLADMNISRYLPNAVGIQLDLIGRIVGLDRPAGATDVQYIQDLFGQIKINTSQGQPEQAIQTYQLFTGAAIVLLFELFSGEVMIESPYTPPDQATIDLLISILTEVLPAGVRPHGIVAYNPARKFAYAGVLPSSGYGTASDASVGGTYPHFYHRSGFFKYAGQDPTGRGYGSVVDPLVGGRYAS